MGELTVQRWRRFGHDRLYVSAGGVGIGWVSLSDDKEQAPEDPQEAREFRAAIEAWCAENLGQRTEPGEQNPEGTGTAEEPGQAPTVPAPAPGVPRQRDSQAAHPGGAGPTMPSPGPVVPAEPDLSHNPPGKATLARAERMAARREAAVAQAHAKADGAREAVLRAAQEAEEYRKAHPIRAFVQGLLTKPRPVEEQVQEEVDRILGELPDTSPTEQNWRIGAEGEQLTGAELSRLDPPWRVLHAVPVGRRGSDIDHVVIGPGGVFTLNTKHHRKASVWVAGDAFKVNGTWTKYVEKSRYEAARAGALLESATGRPVPVTPVVVLVGINALTVKEPPQGLQVLRLEDLRAWLGQCAPVLSPQEVEAVYGKARYPSTWTRG